MSARTAGRWLYVSLLALSIATPAYAATPAARADPPWPGGAGWNGVWIERNSILYKYGAELTPGGPVPPLPEWPLRGVYAARLAALQKKQAAGIPQGVPTATCLPSGMPYTMRMPYVMEVLATPGQLTLINEFQAEIRRIYSDGRPHPRDLEPSYEGHSIGRWEGDVLVVDTTGVRDDTALDVVGAPHSDALTITERWRLIDGKVLEDVITLTDSKAFTRPVVFHKVFDRAPPRMELQEFVCENNRDTSQGVSPGH